MGQMAKDLADAAREELMMLYSQARCCPCILYALKNLRLVNGGGRICIVIVVLCAPF